ncbi:MAG: hypothetical protein AAF403_06925, partial [Pseudomonadota bacterium]
MTHERCFTYSQVDVSWLKTNRTHPKLEQVYAALSSRESFPVVIVIGEKAQTFASQAYNKHNVRKYWIIIQNGSEYRADISIIKGIRLNSTLIQAKHSLSYSFRPFSSETICNQEFIKFIVHTVHLP